MTWSTSKRMPTHPWDTSYRGQASMTAVINRIAPTLRLKAARGTRGASKAPAAEPATRPGTTHGSRALASNRLSGCLMAKVAISEIPANKNIWMAKEPTPGDTSVATLFDLVLPVKDNSAGRVHRKAHFRRVFEIRAQALIVIRQGMTEHVEKRSWRERVMH